MAETNLTSGRLLILSSRKRPSGTAVLYLYGSLFVDPPKKEDFQLAAKLIDKTGCDVCFLLHPLFPDYTLHDMVQCTREAIRFITSRYQLERTAVLAFSTGCTLCLGALCGENEEPLRKPAHLILNSPILRIPANDALMKQMQVLDHYDCVLPAEYFRKDGICGALIDAEPEESRQLRDPLFGSLNGLAATDVYFGTYENAFVYLPEMIEKYRRAGIPLKVHEGEGMMHCWAVRSGGEEANSTMKEYVQLIRGLK